MSRRASYVAALLVFALAVGCDDPVVVGNQTAPQTPPNTPAPSEATPEEQLDAGPPDAGLAFSDEDFVEIEAENRDPFRSFAKLFKVRAVRQVQYRVTMPNTSIDEMRLIALITGVAQPRAMLQDQVGVGHVVKPGDYIGRPEVIQTGGADSMPVTLNWRVERIRRGEVVLARRDPTDPERPPLTRVIPLHEEDAELDQLQLR